MVLPLIPPVFFLPCHVDVLDVTLLFFLCRGVLAIAWSLADPELLLSCGKDSRILCWNPNTAEVNDLKQLMEVKLRTALML